MITTTCGFNLKLLAKLDDTWVSIETSRAKMVLWIRDLSRKEDDSVLWYIGEDVCYRCHPDENDTFPIIYEDGRNIDYEFNYCAVINSLKVRQKLLREYTACSTNVGNWKTYFTNLTVKF